MKLSQRVAMVNSKESLAEFVQALLVDLQENRDQWENPSLELYLEAMASWIDSMDGYYRNAGKEMPQTPTWQTFAQILHAAQIYE